MKTDVLYYIVMMLPYELSVICYFIGYYFNNSIILNMGVVFIVFSLIFYGFLKSVKFTGTWWEWLNLYRENMKFEMGYFIFNFTIGTIMWFIHLFFPQYYKVDITNHQRTGIFIYFMITSFIGLKIIQLCANHIGAGYTSILKYFEQGVKHFSKFAFLLLSNNDKRGVKYLRLSLKHLKSYFKSNNFRIITLDEVIKIININNKHDENIDYKSYIELSDTVVEYINIKNLIQVLNTFEKDDKYSWTKYIENIKFKLPAGSQTLIIVATIVAMFNNIISMVQKMGAENLVQILISIFPTSIFEPYFITFYTLLILFVLWYSRYSKTNIPSELFNEYFY